MHKIALFIAVLLVGCGAVAGEIDYSDIPQISNVSTGGTVAVTTNETPVLVNGLVRAIVIDLSGNTSSATVDVDVVSSGPFFDRTILSTNSVVGDAEVRLGVLVPLVAETIKAWGSNANQTGVHVKVDCILEIEP